MIYLFLSILAICATTLHIFDQINSRKNKILGKKIDLKFLVDELTTKQEQINEKLKHIDSIQQSCLDLRDDLNRCLIANGFKNQNKE